MRCERKNQIFLKSPTLLNKIQEHFNCQDISRLLLEDQGSQGTTGSHLEKFIFGNELMCGSNHFSPRFSKMTLALMKDSGWYEVDFDKADLFEFGKGTGCQIFQKTCNLPGFQELCPVLGGKSIGCSRDNTFRAQCEEDHLTNGCLFMTSRRYDRCQINRYGGYNFEIFGPNSKCQEIEILNERNSDTEGNDIEKVNTWNSLSICVEFKCSKQKTSYKVVIMNPKTNRKVSLKCRKKGQVKQLNKIIRVVCADPEEICPQKSPQSCYERGMCLEDGSCRCDDFFSGPDCSTFLGCQSLNNPKLCDLIKRQYLVTEEESGSLQSEN